MKQYDDAERINLVLGPKSSRALDELQVATESNSKSETIRVALQLMAQLVRESRAGGRVVVERRDGDRIKVILPIPR